MLPAGASATVATALPVNGPEVPRLRPVELLSNAEYSVVLLSFSVAVIDAVCPSEVTEAVLAYCNPSSTPDTCAAVVALAKVIARLPPV